MGAQKALKDLGRYPCIERYLADLIGERLQLPDPWHSPIVRIFVDEQFSPAPLEDLLRRVEMVPNFEQIFEVRLGDEPEPDEKINDIVAEVRALHHVVYERPFRDVAVVARGQAKTVDVTAAVGDLHFAIEVKHPRGPEWKGHQEVGTTGAYLLDQGEKLMEVVRRQVGDALRQIQAFRQQHRDRDYQGVVLVVNTREEWSLFYQDHVHEALRRVMAEPPRGVDLAGVATIDFIDNDGKTYFCANESWPHRHQVDIWPL